MSSSSSSLVSAALSMVLAGSVLAATGPASAAPEDRGLSAPVEDSYYPGKGDPGVDTLHYDLDLRWLRPSRTLVGDASIRFRATETDDHVQLDLAPTMRVRRVQVDGARVGFTHTGTTLRIAVPVAAGERHTARVVYRGRPTPARGPASRTDVSRLGIRTTKAGQLWTMQEPFGAFTWYPANDQPSDKALYDVRVDAPGRWTGVSNGRLVSRRTAGGRTVTQWTNQHPMSTYLVTLAVGPYREHRQTGPHGLPLSYWVPKGERHLLQPLLRTPEAVRWLEQKLGRYPFDRLGVVVTPSDSAMETQTMITFGADNYHWGNRSVRQTMVHEIAHHWYGDTVTPTDWRDLWLNEGMATYLDTRWIVDQGWDTWRSWQRYWAEFDGYWRREYGAPGAYEPREFASINVYYCTALMWDALRRKVGNEQFDQLVRRWPQRHRDSNQSRESYVAWAEAQTGEELSAFFERWLTSRTSPA